MSYDYSQTLNPQKALIWRIVHRDNISWAYPSFLPMVMLTMHGQIFIPI